MTRKPPLYLLAAVVILAGLALVPLALAGKPAPAPTPTATITSSCNPCAVDTNVHFSGSGYDPSEPRGMAQITDAAGGTTWIGINFASDGTTSFDLFMSPTGTYDIKILQNSRRKLVLKAELSGLLVR